jgi:4-hydroxybenzoate polyprenyltransferase
MDIATQIRQWRRRINDILLRIDAALLLHFPVFHHRFPGFWRLARMDRPIGIFLLLWPTLWCLWIAAQGRPDPKLFMIFVLGTVCMRAAGCCINDYADRNFDGHVKRTRARPIITGEVSPGEALKFCGALCLTAFMLVLLTNQLTVQMSFAALGLAVLYPFMKRYTHLAQLFLGAAFSWGGLMAFTAQTGELPMHAWLLYIANFTWTVVYDTQYAMVDREDDLKIGVRSTAILFAEMDTLIIGVLQVFFLITMSLSAQHFGLGIWFQAGLVVAAGLFAFQQYLIRDRDPDKCFEAFLNNNLVGLAIFFFTAVDLSLS